MIRETSCKNTLNRLRHAVSAFGLLLSLAILPASAQQVHQLSYTGSWSDTNPAGATTDTKTGVARIPDNAKRRGAYFLPRQRR
jgi:hypothetical protein